MNKRQRLVLTAAASLQAAMLATPAAAHVSVWPKEAAARGYQAFTVRVPTERDSPTVSVRVELPAVFKGVRFQPKPGWTYEIERDAAGVAVGVTWSGSRIGRDEYEEFHFVARMPDEPTTLVLPAHQKYEDGEIVDWVEGEGAKRPAARVQVTEARAGRSSASSEHMGQALADPATAGQSPAGSTGRSGGTQGWVAWGGLLVAVTALVLALRPSRWPA
ncbi:MAG: YcnI family protein [bacterium]